MLTHLFASLAKLVYLLARPIGYQLLHLALHFVELLVRAITLCTAASCRAAAPHAPTPPAACCSAPRSGGLRAS